MPRSPFRFFKSKVGLAIMGACLIGGTSAVVAAKTAPGRQFGTVASTNQVANSSNPTSSSGTGTAASASPTSTPVDGASPTATANSIPTSTPRPPTPTPAVGQVIHVNGSIHNKNSSNNTFSLVGRTGGTTIIDVNGSTTYSGFATSWTQVQDGLDGDVTCQVQPDRSCLASQVNTDN